MRFNVWMEVEASLGSNMPDMLASMPNRGSNTPASDEVKRTGLQPQVDSQEIHTKEKDEQDKLMAIDAGIERLDKEIPKGSDSDAPKLNKFKEIWNNLKEKWDEIKISDDEDDQGLDGEGGLGDNVGNNKYTQTMQQNPNMMPPQQANASSQSFGMN